MASLITSKNRSRVIYLLLVLGVILLGLLSRRFPHVLPPFLTKSAGDALWALMVFLGIGFLWPSLSTLHSAFAALVFSFLIETSQLYHAPWIDSIRATFLGHLVLGSGFAWADFTSYLLGVIIGVLGEWAATRTLGKRLSQDCHD